MTARTRARVCALVEAGDAPGRNPLLPPLRSALADAGVELVAWDPTGAFPLPPDPPQADLYLVKGDDPAVLTAAGCLADAGARCLNPVEATALVADKARALARVAAAGVPVPRSRVVGTPDELARALADGARFVKPVRGAHGEGAQRLGPGEHERAGRGPWLVQEVLAGDGFDLKVYGVGDAAAVRRARFVPGVVDLPREPVADLDPRIPELARAAARSCGLVLWGADFLPGPDGPVLVDLNAFPGYRGVPEAPEQIAQVVLAELRR